MINTVWSEVLKCAGNDLEDLQDENLAILQDENGSDLLAHSGIFSCRETDWNNIL